MSNIVDLQLAVIGSGGAAMDVGTAVEAAFNGEGMEVLNQTQVSRVGYFQNNFILDTSSGTLRAEQLLIATGQTANTEALNLDGIGVKTSSGAVQVDTHQQTTVRRIYAAGDCTDQPQFV